MPPSSLVMADFCSEWNSSPLSGLGNRPPWEITTNSEAVVRSLLAGLPNEYRVDDEIAVHPTAVVEAGATLKGPLILGPDCFVASGAYLRGGNWVSASCIFGPGSELKSSFVFAGTKLAHFNFVGDSILGADVNLEAGSIVCNYRNERDDKEVRVRIGTRLTLTGVEKFGALVGDRCRIGANAVIAPGAVLEKRSVVGRGSLRDDDADSAFVAPQFSP